MERFLRNSYDDIPPLTERIFKTQQSFVNPPPSSYTTTVASLRPQSYKQYSQEVMTRAIKAVNEGMSVRRAALEYNVPKTTLNDRIQGKVVHGSSSGKTKYLSDEEEEELVRFLMRSASIGYSRSRTEVIAIVQRVCSSKGLDVTVTHGWWEAFCRRHPSIALRKPAHLALSRAKSSDPESLSYYFDLLEKTLTEYNLLDKPSQIFNIDETGVPLNPDASKSIFKRGAKNPVMITSGDKSQVTVVGCVSAAGYCIPPMIIWDRKTLHPDMAEGELPGTIYGFSSKGWIDQELFHIWFECHFLRYAPPVRPLLLLMDGHSSHFCPDTIRMASKEEVVLFTLPPNTTHLSQPLDKGCFAPLKNEWKKVCHDFLVREHKVVTQYTFNKLFSQAWMKSMTIKNILAGFRVSGIYPLDRSKLLVDKADIKPLEEMKFNPLITPVTHIKHDSKFSPCIFSDKEMNDFHCQYPTAAVDTDTDENSEQYVKWKEMYRPYTVVPVCENDELESPLNCSLFHTPTKTNTDVVMVAQCGRPLRSILKYPSPITKVVHREQKSTSRVLTSAENLKILEEKQKMKDEKQRQKEERQKQKEERQRLKEMAKQTKVKASGVTRKTKISTNKVQVYSMDEDSTDDSDVESYAINMSEVTEMTSTSEPKPAMKTRGMETRGKKQVPEPKQVESIARGKKQVPEPKQVESIAMMTRGKKPVSEPKQVECIAMKTRGMETRGKKQVPEPKQVECIAMKTRGMETRGKKPVPEPKQAENPAVFDSDWWIKDLDLKDEDCYLLCNGHHISDRIVNASQKLMKRQYNVGGLQNTLLGQNLSFKAVSNTDAAVVQILHTGVSHWICTSIICNCVKVMDSLVGKLNHNTILQIAKITNTHLPFIELQIVPAQQQENTSNAFAIEICLGNPVESVSFEQCEMRAHLFRFLINHKFTKFPSTKKKVQRPFLSSKVLRIDVYCIYRMPDFFDYDIECDSCQEWFHYECVSIESVDNWICRNCEIKESY